MKNPSPGTGISRTGESFFEAVALAFPVAAYSDEFYFFPQTLQTDKDWSRWDDYTDEKVEEFADRCRAWEEELGKAQAGAEGEEAVDAVCLARAVRTLREQFEVTGFHRSQPTFHLTVAAAGLAEALEHDGEGAWQGRCAGLVAFLDRAAGLLQRVPAVFLAAGSAMAEDLADWLGGLPAGGRAAAAMRGFADHLARLRGTPDFLLPTGQYDHLLAHHYGTGTGSAGALAVIEEEVEEMEELLTREAGRLGMTGGWREAAGRMPLARTPAGGTVDLYRRESKAMARHCLAAGTGLGALVPEAPLRVETVPAHLEAVRASDAYQSLPGTPPRGGIFFVRPRSAERTAGPTVEYRMTCAHETWPGHHLLDICRWSGRRPLRSFMEFPLFYEGWACLAEELMAATGYFDGPWDRFALAWRRLRRAVRGRVDIGLQTGGMDAPAAAAHLVRAGFPPGEAAAVIPKFALRPGYQVCYTLGLRRFLALLNDDFGGEPWVFARQVLGEGEIGFDELGKILAGEGA